MLAGDVTGHIRSQEDGRVGLVTRVAQLTLHRPADQHLADTGYLFKNAL